MKFLRTARLSLIALLLVLCTLFASCNQLGTLPNPYNTTEGTTSATTPPHITTPEAIPEDTDPEGTTEDNAPEATTPEATTPGQTQPDGPLPPDSEVEIPALSMPQFDPASVPDFSGTSYVAVNNNIPFFTKNQLTTSSYEYYSELDALKRCGITVACLGKDLMPTTGRESISHVYPSGWVQANYDGYLYNRSHLIGFQLTGENDNVKNLITGTSYFNQGGMLTFENMVADYIKETNNHVLYRVTPIFVGNELVARGVLMEAWSVEDDGDGICFNVYVYNVQPGVEIDYATGKSQLSDSPILPDQGEKKDYIANKNSKVFHYPSCSSVSKMNEANKIYAHETREQMIADGYKPCGTCKP